MKKNNSRYRNILNQYSNFNVRIKSFNEASQPLLVLIIIIARLIGITFLVQTVQDNFTQNHNYRQAIIQPRLAIQYDLFFVLWIINVSIEFNIEMWQ